MAFIGCSSTSWAFRFDYQWWSNALKTKEICFSMKHWSKIETLTAEQKQCPQGRVTGASKTSPQMVHLSDASRFLKPGAEVGKSVGSGTSE